MFIFLYLRLPICSLFMCTVLSLRLCLCVQSNDEVINGTGGGIIIVMIVIVFVLVQDVAHDVRLVRLKSYSFWYFWYILIHFLLHIAILKCLPSLSNVQDVAHGVRLVRWKFWYLWCIFCTSPFTSVSRMLQTISVWCRRSFSNLSSWCCRRGGDELFYVALLHIEMSTSKAAPLKSIDCRYIPVQKMSATHPNAMNHL